MKPDFSIVCIAKNEELTLPRLISSLKEFQERGGQCVLVDTGSADNTAKIAQSAGWIVEEVGEKYLYTIDKELAESINATFIAEGEEAAVKEGDKYFHFAKARNHASSLSPTDWVCTVDCDEVLTKLDIDKINEIIKNPDLAHLEYEFIFSHDQFGKPAIQFVQSKMFSRKKIEWTGIVHEVISSKNGGGIHQYMPPDIFLLEHWQMPGDRHSYLRGLLVDCYLHPKKDRNSHYTARELMWSGRPKSAIKEFERHITLNGWLAERSQSMIHIGDCFGQLNQPEKQAESYLKAFNLDGSRREPLIKLARLHQQNNNPLLTSVFATAALEIPWTAFYANNKAHYEQEPHEILYWAKGWLGDIESARKHILKALDYQPYNPKYLSETMFYFDYHDKGIQGWMKFEELLWLYETAKKMKSIIEVGSWKGRSTHALLSGCTEGEVIAVDHFEGSEGGDKTKGIVQKEGNVYKQFMLNVGYFKNLKVMKMSSEEAQKSIFSTDKRCDMIFIDAEHTYEGVKKDIELWTPIATEIICGHDYCPEWPGVVRAVDEMLGTPDEIHGTIWVKYL